MKKYLLFFFLIITTLISCKSDEQKKYNELIEMTEEIYNEIKDHPKYLYSSNNFVDPKYQSILDRRGNILRKSKDLFENAKFDDRPTEEQKRKLWEILLKIETILNEPQKDETKYNTNPTNTIKISDIMLNQKSIGDVVNIEGFLRMEETNKDFGKLFENKSDANYLKTNFNEMNKDDKDFLNTYSDTVSMVNLQVKIISSNEINIVKINSHEFSSYYTKE
jgi:hypothetical protein